MTFIRDAARNLSLIVGTLIGAASIVSIILNGFPIELTEAPLAVYEYYATVRNLLFKIIYSVIFSWWIIIDLPNIIEDIIALYFLLGFAFARANAIYTMKLESHVGFSVSFESDADFTQTCKRIIIWPLNVFISIELLKYYDIDEARRNYLQKYGGTDAFSREANAYVDGANSKALQAIRWPLISIFVFMIQMIVVFAFFTWNFLLIS